MVEHDLKSMISPNVVPNPNSLIFNQDSIFEGNLGNINRTIKIDILVKHGVVEHIHIG